MNDNKRGVIEGWVINTHGYYGAAVVAELKRLAQLI